MSPRSEWTSVTVRAEDLAAGEVALIGGLAFTRLKAGGALTKTAEIQKPRFVKILARSLAYATQQKPKADPLDVEWVEVMFKGGNCPTNSRVMFALFRPYELVRVQVEKVR